MAKYLNKPCVDINLKTILITRKPNEVWEDGVGVVTYQTCYTFIGERIDEDGKVLESFHEAWTQGSPGSDKWDSDTSEQDVEAVAAATKALFEDILTESTTP
jgi:hypothetical protein